MPRVPAVVLEDPGKQELGRFPAARRLFRRGLLYFSVGQPVQGDSEQADGTLAGGGLAEQRSPRRPRHLARLVILLVEGCDERQSQDLFSASLAKQQRTLFWIRSGFGIAGADNACSMLAQCRFMYASKSRT